MKFSRLHLTALLTIVLIIILLVLIGRIQKLLTEFSSTTGSLQSEQVEAFEAIRLESVNDINVRMGQEIYVPVYSTLKAFDPDKEIDLAITLSVRNTDPKHPILVQSVDFYRSDGDRFKRFISSPLEIRPMATKEFNIPRTDEFGGSGANFYIVWVSDTLVTEPIVEAIMLGAATQGYSWVSSGKVVKSTLKDH